MKKEIQSFEGSFALASILVLCGVVILGTVSLLPIRLTRCDHHAKAVSSVRFVITIMHAVPLLLAGYTVHCLIDGKCALWSYTLIAVILAWTLFVIIMLMELARSAAPTPRHVAYEQPLAIGSVTLPFLTSEDETFAEEFVEEEQEEQLQQQEVDYVEGDDIVTEETFQQEEQVPASKPAGEPSELDAVMQKYMQHPRDAVFHADTFGSASSDMGYDDTE